MSQRIIDWLFDKSRFRSSTPRTRNRLAWPLAAQIELLEDRTLLSHILGTADSFAVLGGSTVTNTGPSVITGDLGVSPGSAVVGFPPGIVTPPGTIHAADAVAAQAQSDVTIAYNDLAGRATNVNLTGQDLGGLTLTPGVYTFSSSAQLTGTLTLDAQGNPNAEFIFQIGSTITTASGSSVMMINNGNPCAVYWQVGSSATLGTTTAFIGHILAQASITMNTGATLDGSALAQIGAVTLDTNQVSNAGCEEGSISGLKFNDLNGDGAQQPGEPGLSGITIFLDYNNDGLLSTGETSTTTGLNGNYSFSNLLSGTYLVREVQQPGVLLQTTLNPAAFTLNPGQTVSGVNFGNFRLISISGTKFNDLDNDGFRDPGDLGLAGVTVFLDTNNDGTLDPGEVTATTDASGNYSFTNVGPGTFRVREVPPVGSTQTTANPADIVASSGSNISGVLFGNFLNNFQPVSISGTKFNDLNGNTIRDPGDPGLAGVTVFLDTNGNSTLDLGELSTTSDVNGNFTFTNLGPGTYSIREVQVAGSTQTTVNPADITVSSDTDVTGVLFGNFQLVSIGGLKFNDFDGDGVRDPGDPGLAGVTVFLDTDFDGILDPGERFTTTDASGNYSFTNVGPGTFRVREVQTAGSTQTTANPADIITSSGTNVGSVAFGNFQLVSIGGLKFNDLNGNGVRDPGDPSLAGVTVFLDTDFDGILDPGERFTTTDASGNYSFANVGPGMFRVREVTPAGSTQTTANPADVVASSGTNVAVPAFGNFRLISINGTKFRDTNGSGTQNAGELGLAGFTIFLDANNNRMLDPGEISTVSGVNGSYTFSNLGPGTYRVREVQQPTMFVQMTNNPPTIVATSGTNVAATALTAFGNIPVANLATVSKLLFTGNNLANLLNGTFGLQANFVANLYQNSALARAPTVAELTKYLRLLMAGYTQLQVTNKFLVDNNLAVPTPLPSRPPVAARPPTRPRR